MLSKGFEEQGLGYVHTYLTRTTPVQKAAFASSENRPKALDHFRSITCTPGPHVPKRIVLIDDIVTRGATLLGCASRLTTAFPRAKIVAFAVMRTISDPDIITHLRDPCAGTIRL